MLSEQQFQAIFQEAIRPLYRTVSRRASGDRELTEDIVQETFLRAVKAWRQDGLPAEPLAWLNRVALNLLSSHYRSSRNKQKYVVQSPRQGRDDAEDSVGLKQLLSKGLARLGGNQRAVLCAYHVEGRSTREIAEEMEISERAVEGRLRRARISLREKLHSLLSKETENV